MHRVAASWMALMMALLVSGVTGARSPEPSASIAPTEGELAVAAVRATDPRFAHLPTFEEARREMAATFGYEPLLARSWIGLVDTLSALTDLGPGMPAWTDTGVGRIVEVMLVDGCADEIDGMPATDPCSWRHTWTFHVSRDGTVQLVAESGAPDRP